MGKYGSIVNDVVGRSDIILYILDARFIKETRNISIEKELKRKRKVLIHVINKCDSVEKSAIVRMKKGLENCVFVSATKRLGTTILRHKIRMLSKRHGLVNPVVGVVGYPNVGKSSVINALKGSYSARTSPEAGFTKGEQQLQVGKEFSLLDTPGVIPIEQSNENELVMIGAKNPQSIKDPEMAVIHIMKEHPGLVGKMYSIKESNDEEAVIGEIALMFNMKKKGNLPDTERAARKILNDLRS